MLKKASHYLVRKHLMLLDKTLTFVLQYIHCLWSWTLYSGCVGLAFALVKYLNSRLHHLFDTSEGTEEPLQGGPSWVKSGSFGGIAVDHDHEMPPSRDILVHQVKAFLRCSDRFYHTSECV